MQRQTAGLRLVGALLMLSSVLILSGGAIAEPTEKILHTFENNAQGCFRTPP
jgi:hypothetical protein